MNLNLEQQTRLLVSGKINGVTSEITQDAMRDFLTRGAEYVIKRIPNKLLTPFATEVEVPSDGYALSSLRLSGILSVRRGNHVCRRVSSDMKGKFIDPTSLHYVPSNTKNPVYYEYNGKIFVLPNGDAYVSYVNLSDISSDITDLLGELDDAVVSYAASSASKILYNYHSEQNEDVELANLHKTNSAEFLQAANLMIDSYLSGKGFNLQPQQGGQG
tara:strand:+ start:1218 stop:1865 length:648 start_codon:yes stop_codon:yes gene_type:complete